jgi:HlyD family secretion protein
MPYRSVWMLHAATVLVLVLATGAAVAEGRAVSSLGRIEPHNGVYKLAGPSEASVVATLRVEEGDRVTAGQVLATMDSYDLRVAELQRAEVDLEHAKRVQKRNEALKQNAFQSVAAIEESDRDVRLRETDVLAARARLALASVRAPSPGQILAIHAREGERIGPRGLLELGRTDRMYVVAEVYETDIGRVQLGQHAIARSPALQHPVVGKVERISYLVARSDALGLDPIARTDSRVVEVRILLDEPAKVAALTNLEVTVQIGGPEPVDREAELARAGRDDPPGRE